MYETLKEILRADLRLDGVDIHLEAALDEVGLDSLALVELSMALSSRLAIEIAEHELMNIQTVNQIVRLMEERAAQS
jgi:acyl carrier protein